MNSGFPVDLFVLLTGVTYLFGVAVRNGIGTTGFVTALALSATLVDATPFSTVGALGVANASDTERPHVYNGMLAWGLSMVIVAPIVTWLVFVLPGRWI